MKLISKDVNDFTAFVDCVTNREDAGKFKVKVTMDKEQYDACAGLGLNEERLNEIFDKLTISDADEEYIVCDIIKVEDNTVGAVDTQPMTETEYAATIEDKDYGW